MQVVLMVSFGNDDHSLAQIQSINADALLPMDFDETELQLDGTEHGRVEMELHEFQAMADQAGFSSAQALSDLLPGFREWTKVIKS